MHIKKWLVQFLSFHTTISFIFQFIYSTSHIHILSALLLFRSLSLLTLSLSMIALSFKSICADIVSKSKNHDIKNESRLTVFFVTGQTSSQENPHISTSFSHNDQFLTQNTDISDTLRVFYSVLHTSLVSNFS